MRAFNIVGVFLFVLSVGKYSFAEAPKETKWEHEQKAVAEAKKRAEQSAPYWLRDFSKQSDFKEKSLEMAAKIAKMAAPNASSFCIATFMNSNRIGKNATLLCTKQNTTNGYDSTCTPLQINLGTGKNLSTGMSIGAKCDQDTASRLMRMSPTNLLLETDLYSGGFDGDLGILVYKDDFGVVKKWLANQGDVNRPKAKSAKKKKNANED